MTRESDEGRRGYWVVLLARGILAAVLALVVTFNADHSPVLGLAVYGAFWKKHLPVVTSVLVIMPIIRVASYLWGWITYLVPGPP